MTRPQTLSAVRDGKKFIRFFFLTSSFSNFPSFASTLSPLAFLANFTLLQHFFFDLSFIKIKSFGYLCNVRISSIAVTGAEKSISNEQLLKFRLAIAVLNTRYCII